MIPPAMGKPLSTKSRMLMAAVCQPLATSPPKNDAFPAAASRWNGWGSNCWANVLPTVEELFRVITSNTLTAVVDRELIGRLDRGEKVTRDDLQAGSV